MLHHEFLRPKRGEHPFSTIKINQLIISRGTVDVCGEDKLNAKLKTTYVEVYIV
jgi:hypothetical protein